jgi:hypothetical protein
MLRLCDVQPNQFARILTVPQDIREEIKNHYFYDYSLVRIIAAHHLIIFECNQHIFCISSKLAAKIMVLIIPTLR